MVSSENDRPGCMVIHSMHFGGIGLHFYEFGVAGVKKREICIANKNYE